MSERNPLRPVDGGQMLRIQDEVYVLNKGWRCNPIGDEVVTAVRRRFVSEWETTPLHSGDRIPDDVMHRMGVLYTDEKDV